MAVEKKIVREEGSESIEVILRSGQSLRVRPIRPDDKKRLEGFFYRLSPHTRYLRFQYAKESITEEELKYFTEVTPPQRYAYVATVGEADSERILAVGRWDMLPDKRTAEVAFTVEDNIQMRGVGTILIEELSRAAAKFNIAAFEAQVLQENTRMLEVFEESGFRLRKRFSSGVYSITIDLKDQEEYEKRQAQRDHIARSAGVKRLLCPRRVAVVGASRNPESVGGALFRNLLKDGFNGVALPVNPKAESIAGVLAYPTVLDCPGDVDIAIVVVPAEQVLSVVDECAKKSVAGLVIISAGFGESGAEGRGLERELREKVLSYGMRVIGPNCLGILNNNPDVRLNATFSPVTPPSGNLSIGSQSGALGLALLDRARSINLGISSFVSFGNRIDISTNDLLDYWEDDANTDVIVLYQESFGEAKKFGRIARRVSRRKPIIAVKAGRSRAGAAAATSHTGALAASDVAVDALFRHAGVIRVTTIEEMFNAADILTHQPLPRGPRVGILTNAGGPGVLAADACEGLGLKVTPLSDGTQRKLREFLPKAAAVTNPVDMIATAPPESFKKALSIMLGDPDIDSIIVIYIPPLVTRPEDVAEAVGEALSSYMGDKPVITCFMMSESALGEIRKSAKRPLRPFIFPEAAVQALSLAYNYSQYREMDEGTIVRFPEIDADKIRGKAPVREILKRKGWLMPEEAIGLLREYGITAAETLVARSADEAALAADRLGYPVVMKIRSSRIAHKTDVGGIAVDLRDAEDVKRAFSMMLLKVESAGFAGETDGVILQRMAKGGQEMIVGMSQDPLFGPLVMIGLGGVSVELLKDVAFSIHPLRDADTDRMLRELKSLPLLQGYRGRPPGDIMALKEALLRFSSLVEDFPEIDQIEINPLLVLEDGNGVIALDARVYMNPGVAG
ncbi:MAG: GNAT family N-acetyltransferase [Deltaproteobacteria bacterium]|nr:GNAT family N-acetyltransferase [Deltaproteobacteria bacterium]